MFESFRNGSITRLHLEELGIECFVFCFFFFNFGSGI